MPGQRQKSAGKASEMDPRPGAEYTMLLTPPGIFWSWETWKFVPLKAGKAPGKRGKPEKRQ